MGLTTAVNLTMGKPSSAPEPDSRLLNDGAVVGNWKVLALVGIGGNGEVYRVKHLESGEIGALKAPHLDLPQQRQRFELETEILKKISTRKTKGARHFPRFLDEGLITGKDTPYIVIEFLQDFTLPEPPARRMRKSAVKKLVLEVCEGVQELHANGYLHRDIKPENLMRREDGTVVLIDFGFAVRIEDAENPLAKRVSQVTKGGQLGGIGTEGAMAPEQAFGHASVRSDIFAIGGLANKCFRGNPPAKWLRIIQKATSPNDEFRYEDIAQLEKGVRNARYRLGCINYFLIFLAAIILFTVYVGSSSSEEQMPAPPKVELPQPTNTVYLSEKDGLSQEELSADRFRKPAEHGDLDAQNKLGVCYDFGLGVEKDEASAAKWYRRAAEQGFAKAQFNIAGSYWMGRGVDKNPTEAESWCRKAAEQGYVDAQYELTARYWKGIGVEKNQNEAVKWCHKAAELGLAEAQFDLAGGYMNGNGVEKDPAEGMRWLRKAAEQGYSKAQYLLGYCCLFGEGIEPDLDEAESWYLKSAKQGNMDAEFALADFYHRYDATPNLTNAVFWYRKAAEHGHVKAQYLLGNCYRDGDGVEVDNDEALKWYKKAATQGDDEAKRQMQYMLGESGVGTLMDPVRLHRLYSVIKWAFVGFALLLLLCGLLIGNNPFHKIPIRFSHKPNLTKLRDGIRTRKKTLAWFGIGIAAAILASTAYNYVQENKKSFAMSCLKEVLKSGEAWDGQGGSDYSAISSNIFCGVRFFDAGNSCNDYPLVIPFIPENKFKLNDIFVSDSYSKRIVSGKIVGVYVRRELSPTLTDAIRNENDDNGVVKRAMKETLSLIGEPYRSRGWYWNSYEYIIGAQNHKEELERLCVSISCRLSEENGGQKAYIEIGMEMSGFHSAVFLNNTYQYFSKSNRNFQMHQEASNTGRAFEDLIGRRFTGIFGIELGSVISCENPEVMNDGAFSLFIEDASEPFGRQGCTVFALPQSREVFKISHTAWFENKTDALDFYTQATEYFKKKHRRRLVGELYGEPYAVLMWPGVVIAKKDTIEFTNGRMLKFECAQIEKDGFCVNISATDYPMLNRLPKEVEDLLKSKTNHPREVAH